MEKTKGEENRSAYDEFLARLDRQMREALGMGPPIELSEVDKHQALPAAEKPGA